MEDQLFNDEMLLGIRTGAKLIEVKKTNGLVKLNKEFLGIELGFLNKKELELLYILCLAYKERQVQSIKIHIKEIKELMSSGEKEIRKTDIENYVETLHKRLAKVNIRTNKSGSGISGTLNLFEYVITDTRDFETGIVTIIAKVTDTAMNFFNNLEGKRNKYLRFLIEDAIKLKGKYSALLLPHLIACSKDKKFEISFENLEELLGIKGKYSRKTDFNKRILKPTVEELEIIFKDLKVKGLKKNELDPRKITDYIFTWSNNINYDDKKEETSFFYQIEETNNNDKKEYSKIFTGDNVIDKTEEIEVAVADVKKEVIEAEAEVIAETDDLKECELYIKRNVFAEINFNSIKKEVKEIIDKIGIEETLKYFARTWKRLGEQQKKGRIDNRTAYFIYLIKNQLEATPTQDEIREMARIEESRQYEERQKKKGNNKSDWDSPKKEEAKEEAKQEVVKEEKKIEIISYKEYLERKEIELKKLEENSVPTGDKKLDILLRRFNFFNLFKKDKIQVNLTKKEAEQEIENLKNYFQSTNEIIKQEIERITLFVITEEKEEEVKEETKVAVADVKKEVTEVEAEEKEKGRYKTFTIEEIEKVEKQLEELKEWEDEINKLPTVDLLNEMFYNLYCLYRDRNDFIDKYGKENKETIAEFDKEIADLESKRKKLELQLEEEKKELWDRKFSDSAKQKRNNIKSIKDFTIKVTEAKKEEAVADVKEIKKEEAEETDPFDEKDIASIFKK